MNCIIIEDQAPAQRILIKYIKDFGTMTLAGTFSDAIQAMSFLKSNSVDLIFLDIHLPKISGIDFLKSLPHPPAVILTTAFSEYALEGYDLNIVDYLLKPFSFDRFLQAVSKVNTTANSESASKESVSLFVKSGYDYINILIKDILFIKSDLDYTEIHTSGKTEVSSESLSYWEQKLPSEQFTRVHKSYLINISAIRKLTGNQIYLNDDNVIPIGRAYKEEFMSKYVK